MADFSNELFSFNGESPDFLPVRIRLPNGQTRYTQSVTLEELNSCGFTGPISIPEHTVEERRADRGAQESARRRWRRER